MYSLRKGAPGGAKCALQHVLRLIRVAGAAKIILADFNLAVSTPIAKPSNLNPRQIFRLYGSGTLRPRDLRALKILGPPVVAPSLRSGRYSSGALGFLNPLVSVSFLKKFL